ncbi:hypothetical protein N8076_01795 [Gammaproteobacteria bacterium]|nr:hypothetical protein [Gammaproteobacteria bacterium]
MRFKYIIRNLFANNVNMRRLLLVSSLIFSFSQAFAQSELSSSELREIRRSDDSNLIQATIIDLMQDGEPKGKYFSNVSQASLLLNILGPLDSDLAYEINTLALLVSGDIDVTSNRFNTIRRYHESSKIFKTIARVLALKEDYESLVKMHEENFYHALEKADTDEAHRNFAIESALALAYIYANKDTDYFDPKKELSFYIEAAVLGSDIGAFEAAVLIEQSVANDSDLPIEALIYYRQAAASVSAAQLKLAELYYEGAGQFIDRDMVRGSYYLIRAIRQGNDEAEVYRAEILYDGLYGSDVDQQEAITSLSDNNSLAALEFLEQKAKDGDSEALDVLTVKYLLDPSLTSRLENIVSKDVLYRVSNSWMSVFTLSDRISLLNAANNGNPSAQNALGNAFNMDPTGYTFIGCDLVVIGQCKERFGFEDEQLNPEYWLSRAAAQSHPEGLYSYGMLLIDGVFVEKDLIRGASLLLASLESGYDSASSVLDRVVDTELFDRLIELSSREVNDALYNFLRQYEGNDTNLLSVADNYFTQTKYGSIFEAPSQDSAVMTDDVVGDLKELSDLFDRGLLTAEEFASAKTLLLSK